MSKLPVYERYQCALCHTVEEPVQGNAPLNSFGVDFHANGDKWDNALAMKDSDGDGSNNGIELGDDDGDGIPNISRERSNPGNPLDKPSSVDENCHDQRRGLGRSARGGVKNSLLCVNVNLVIHLVADSVDELVRHHQSPVGSRG